MSEAVASVAGAAPAQEQAPTGASGSASYFVAHRSDHTQGNPGSSAPPVDVTASAELQQAHEGEHGATAEANHEAPADQPEKPYNAQETIQAVHEYHPDIDPRSLRLAEGLISRSLNDAQTNPLTPEAIAAGASDCMACLRAQHGAKTDNIITMAQKELAHLAIKFPGLPKILETSGRGNDPWLVNQLAQLSVKRQFRSRK